MQARERYAHSGALAIHYLDCSVERGDAPGTDVAALFVPGFGEEAAEHVAVAEIMAPRRTLLVDLRGRGRSDVPESGWSLEDHVADMEAVIADSGVDRVHLASYSRGTSYALGWAIRNPDRCASVTIGDYPARQLKPPQWFAEKAPTRNWRGRPIVERMGAAAIVALIDTAVDLDLWDGLDALRCPVLLIRGGAEGAMVDDATESRYRRHVPHLEVVTFADSGHDLWYPDPTRFARTWSEFTAR